METERRIAPSWRAGEALEEPMVREAELGRERLEARVMGFGGLMATTGLLGGYVAAPLAVMMGAIAMPALLPAMGASAAVGAAGMGVYMGSAAIADRLIKRRERKEAGAEPGKAPGL